MTQTHVVSVRGIEPFDIGQVLMRLVAELDADGGVGARVPAPRLGPHGPRRAAASVEVVL